MLLINIDSFQEINDFYGNDTGDLILVEMGNRLKLLIGNQKFKLFKMPTDEFAILINDKYCIEDIEKLASYFHEGISERAFMYQDSEIHIAVSIGISLFDNPNIPEDHKTTWLNLPLHADMALKKAKKLRKHFIIYKDSMQISEEYKSNMHWTKKLKEAIKSDNIVPYFQPIVNNKTGVVEKYECLARLIDQEAKVISPFFFINVAKKTRLYHHITRMIFKKSVEFFKDKTFEFSINLSVDDILDKETDLFIKTILMENPEINKYVVFEILESEGIENYDDVKEFIDDVKEFGCKIAIDDFGTGYSNFQHIMKLNVDYIKIDTSMTKYIDKDKNSQLITSIIADFAKKLGIKTISEFVSSEDIYNKVKELGVDYSQGYYFGEPKNLLVEKK